MGMDTSTSLSQLIIGNKTLMKGAIVLFFVVGLYLSYRGFVA